MTAYLFPGQGSQKVGMGDDLFEQFPEFIEQAEELLGYSLSVLCLRDPYGHLNHTEFTQPALYVVNALSYLSKLKETNGRKPEYFLGHSLGEYNALWAAGAFDFLTGLKLVQERARLMSQAIQGGMAAVIGLTSTQVQAVLEKEQLNTLSIANFNSYLQQVISGPKEVIDFAKPYFTSAGARLYKQLPVTGAFHSTFMQSARSELADFLNQFTFTKPEITVIANVTGQPYQEDLHSMLSLHIDHPVQWLQSIKYLLRLSESDFVEVGPGTVLANLVARIVDGQ